MRESEITENLLRVGRMLERGELEHSGAEIDIKHYLQQYLSLHQPTVISSVCPEYKSDDWDSIGKNRRCNKCNERWQQTDL